MNKAAWDALPDRYKAMIEIAPGEAIMLHLRRERGHSQFAAMAEMATSTRVRSSAGATRSWPPREGLARGAGGGIGQGPDVQEGRRPLPGLPQEVLGLGRVAGDENHLSEGLNGGSRCSAGLRQLLPGKLPRRAAMRSPNSPVADRPRAHLNPDAVCEREDLSADAAVLRRGRQMAEGTCWRTVAHGALPRVPPQQDFVAMSALLKLSESMRRAARGGSPWRPVGCSSSWRA